MASTRRKQSYVAVAGWSFRPARTSDALQTRKRKHALRVHTICPRNVRKRSLAVALALTGKREQWAQDTLSPVVHLERISGCVEQGSQKGTPVGCGACTTQCAQVRMKRALPWRMFKWRDVQGDAGLMPARHELQEKAMTQGA